MAERAGLLPAAPRLVLVLAAALLLGGLPRSLAAQAPPNARWRTIETVHFRVSYTAGLDSLARHTGAAAERAYARLSRELAPPPAGKIDLILSDNVDYSNGETTPFPYNHIYLYARPPVGDVDLGFFPDWMEMLVDHELTHTFNLDRTDLLGRGLRRVFGRVPIGWPAFPAEGTPSWSLEGMAVFFESHLTGEGRIYGSYHDMVLRTATLEGKFWPVDRLTGLSPIWPGGDAVYIYGSYFLDWLGERYGPGVEKRIVEATATQRVPSFGTVARRVTHHSWPALYRQWRAALRARYMPVADSVRAAGVTAAQVLTRGGYYALYPRVSPDARHVAFAAAGPRNTSRTSIYDVATGKVRDVARRNSLDPAAWLPDGRLLTTQLELYHRYDVYGDLYVQGPPGHERRLTRGARLQQVDVRRDGRAAVAVQDSAGMTRLVRVELPGALVRPLTPYDATRNWAFPRWSPDGRRIAVGLWRPGGSWDTVVLDSAGQPLLRVARDLGFAGGPAWSPDGRWLLWESDRSGIPDIYAADVGAALDQPVAGRKADPRLPLFQVTNVLTGAFWPDVSPDGRWLYFSGYHADGWHLERMPFQPTSWKPAPVRRIVPRPDTIGILPDAPADTLAGPPHRYSPLPTLWPRFWTPVAYSEAGGTFIGAATSGGDAVGRHSYALTAAYDPEHHLAGWQGVYSYAGLGNPVLQLSASRGWDRFLLGPAANPYTEYRREDDFAAGASFVRARVRTSTALSLGADLALRDWSLVGAPDSLFIPAPRDRLVGVFAGLGFANYQLFPYSISREGGIAASVSARRRWNSGFAPRPDAGYSELYGALAAYPSVPGFGFAHSVLAGRLAGLWRAGPGAEPADIGGVPGQQLSLGLISAGAPGDFLFVRGYPSGARYGTRAWSASLEYRFPIALVDRGWGTAPYYLDRVFGHLFADAGNAWCPAAEMAVLARHGYLCTPYDARPLLGVGAGIGADIRLLIPSTFRFRAGIGAPLTDRAGFDPLRAWITFGASF